MPRQKGKPAAWSRCKDVLEAMWIEADEHGNWEGHLTKKFGQLGISHAFYGKTMYMLQEVGACEQLQRGTSHQYSIWSLAYGPRDLNYEDWLEVYEDKVQDYDSQSIRKRVDLLEQEVRDLKDMVQRNIA